MDHRFKRIFLDNNNSSSYDGGDGDQEINDQSEEAKAKRTSMQQWNTEEKAQFIELLKTHGRNWEAIAEKLPRKTDKQCRNYFQNYKHKLNLIQYLPAKEGQENK